MTFAASRPRSEASILDAAGAFALAPDASDATRLRFEAMPAAAVAGARLAASVRLPWARLAASVRLP